MNRWVRVALGGALLSATGCATTAVAPTVRRPEATQALQGSYHQVRPGETLWRIARFYGLGVDHLMAANRLASAQHLRVGQRLFIPLPQESNRFLWPLRGSLHTTGGWGVVEIGAPPGSLIRASRGGRVALAARQLAGFGKTVVIDHLDGYLTVYSRLAQLLVSPGTRLRQGTPIGLLGAQALHFEIRQGVGSRDAVALLPNP